MTDDDTAYEADAPEPKREPKAAKPYLDQIKEAQRAFAEWEGRVDSIEKKYANLKVLADTTQDREFQIFWANMEVLRPTIYSRPPRPVVDQRHSDSGPVVRQAAEMLQRCLAYDVEADDLHETLKLVRDDLVLGGRGVPWVLDNGQCIHVDRCDFVHEPARKWQEVGWVARRAFLGRKEFEERFPDADVRRVKFEEQKGKDDGAGNDYRPNGKKAQVWEIWSKAEGMVCWVVEGHDSTLDEQPPLIDVKGFYPCPKPAYATLEPRTLRPVPDYAYYRDQLDEINELTARIAALSESLRLKGFYASGASEIGEAIEAAMKATDNKAILVPVSSLAALGGGSLKDSVIWLPVAEVAAVITSLVQLRQQLIQDVYEITGLSDIMRGSTVASETATAQNLKAQYGSVRVRERQAEMVRVAHDVISIKAEILAETVPVQELAVMAGMQLPDNATVQQQMLQPRQQAAMAQQQGQPAPPMPDMSKVVTIEQVGELLANQRTRPFMLDIETDSTIAPNEAEEKQSRIEFITAVSQFIAQAGQMVAQQPETAPFAGEMLKFTASGFRAGRQLGGAIDEFVEQVTAKASNPPPPQPDPAVVKAEADKEANAQKLAFEQQKAQAEMQIKQAELQLKSRELDMRGMEGKAKADADMAAQGLPPGYNFAQHQEQMMALAASVTQGQQQVAAALQAMAQGLAMMAQTANAPRRVVRGPDGSVQGVEIAQLN
jgi:hypothetical protein